MTGQGRADDPARAGGRSGRWAWATIDLDAVEHNVGVLRRAVEPSALWAVVKANGYGHGAVEVARAALRAGAEGLCVALVQEGIELRAAGVDAPVLVFGEQPDDELDALLAHRLIPTVCTERYVDALSRRVVEPIGVHVNVDTGMQRVGVEPRTVEAVLGAIVRQAPHLTAEAIYTHLACADEPLHPANRHQLAILDDVIDRLGPLCPSIVHAANSAAALAIPSARRSFVRAGIAIYGVSPGAAVDHLFHDLRPAMTLQARVARVKRVAAGSSVSYGWRHRFERDTTVATVPIGYADGVPRRLGTLPDRHGADVLIGGRRHQIVGVVTMDQLMVDVGDHQVAVGDDVVLMGEQGAQSIRVDEWADRLGTIGYEIVCGIGARVPRVHVGGVTRMVAHSPNIGAVMLLRAASIADTHTIASVVADAARVGDIIVLAGEMGAGKTAFAQGFGRALGVTEAITSPTFTLVHSYPCPDGRTTLHHADIYRLDDTGDVEELALHELAEFGGIVLVEWGDVASAVLGDHLEVRLSPADDIEGDNGRGTDRGTDGPVPDDDFGLDGARTVEIHATGGSWAGRWDRVTSGLEAFRC